MSYIGKEVKFSLIIFLFMLPFYASYKNLATKTNTILHY